MSGRLSFIPTRRFYAANCRFVSKWIQKRRQLRSPVCELRQLRDSLPESTAIVWQAPQSGARLVIGNWCSRCPNGDRHDSAGRQGTQHPALSHNNQPNAAQV